MASGSNSYGIRNANADNISSSVATNPNAHNYDSERNTPSYSTYTTSSGYGWRSEYTRYDRNGGAGGAPPGAAPAGSGGAQNTQGTGTSDWNSGTSGWRDYGDGTSQATYYGDSSSLYGTHQDRQQQNFQQNSWQTQAQDAGSWNNNDTDTQENSKSWTYWNPNWNNWWQKNSDNTSAATAAGSSSGGWTESGERNESGNGQTRNEVEDSNHGYNYGQEHHQQSAGTGSSRAPDDGDRAWQDTTSSPWWAENASDPNSRDASSESRWHDSPQGGGEAAGGRSQGRQEDIAGENVNNTTTRSSDKGKGGGGGRNIQALSKKDALAVKRNETQAARAKLGTELMEYAIGDLNRALRREKRIARDEKGMWVLSCDLPKRQFGSWQGPPRPPTRQELKQLMQENTRFEQKRYELYEWDKTGNQMQGDWCWIRATHKVDVKSRVDERSKGKGKKGKDARDWSGSANSPGITSTSPSDKGRKGHQRRRDRQENLDASYLEHKTPDFVFWEPLLRTRGLLDEFLGNKTCSTTTWASNASPDAESAGGGSGSANGSAIFGGAAPSSSSCGPPKPNAQQHRDDSSHTAFAFDAATVGGSATDQENQSRWNNGAPQPQWTSSASSREQEQTPAPPPAVNVPQIQRQPGQSSSSKAPTPAEEYYIGTPAPAEPDDAYSAHYDENATTRGGRGAGRSDAPAHPQSPHKSAPGRMGPASTQPLDSSHVITSSGKSLDSVKAVAGGSPDLVAHAATPDLSYDRASSTSRKSYPYDRYNRSAYRYPPPADCVRMLLSGCKKNEYAYAAWQECNEHGEFMKEEHGRMRQSDASESGTCISGAARRGNVEREDNENQDETKSQAKSKKVLKVYPNGKDDDEDQDFITIKWNGKKHSGRVTPYTDSAGTKSDRLALKLDGAWWYCHGYEKRTAESSKRGPEHFWLVGFNDSSGATRFFRDEPKPPKSTPSSTKKSKKEKKSKRVEA
ncbi:unnamed protein product [Amoebophrya sp. A120]|nr:unnamed protein product [Amoebophrya sp. A120]|eukprot:GSA120T00006145001.1